MVWDWRPQVLEAVPVGFGSAPRGIIVAHHMSYLADQSPLRDSWEPWGDPFLFGNIPCRAEAVKSWVDVITALQGRDDCRVWSLVVHGRSELVLEEGLVEHCIESCKGCVLPKDHLTFGLCLGQKKTVDRCTLPRKT